jgi:hypothetical protein
LVATSCSERSLIGRAVCGWTLIFVAASQFAGCLGHTQPHIPSYQLQLDMQEAVVRHWLSVLPPSHIHCLTLGNRRPQDHPMYAVGDPPTALIARFTEAERTVRPGSECRFEVGDRRLNKFTGPRHLPSGAQAVILVFSEVSPSGGDLYEAAVDVIGSGMRQAGYICELRRAANSIIVERCRGTWIS